MIHVLKQEQNLPISISEAWDYFSRPENLNEITPPDMNFRILTNLPERVYPGLMIVYKVQVFPMVVFEWATEITHVSQPDFFVDEQRFGPYAMWHHEHHFREVPGGVHMTDIVHYKLPLGWFGNLFHGLVVKGKLQQIFNFRKEALVKKFGAM
jgi:ligand-binding SRPBCC domain-containing protein